MKSITPGDLRSWLSAAEGSELLTEVKGADWNLELADISRLNYRRPQPKALLFDEIPGYGSGLRVLTSSMSSARLLGMTLRFGADETDASLIQKLRGANNRWAAEAADFMPIVVQDGPVLEHTIDGPQVNLLDFPAPLWNEGDGGRFIGTGCMVVTSDPETGVLNGGAYRIQVSEDGRSATVAIVPGKDGARNVEAWFARSERAPVTITLGHDPLVLLVAGTEVPAGTSELAYAGAIAGQPMEVIVGANGLPFPAASEIVIEGWFNKGSHALEGPFAEWTGYYSESAGDAYLLEISKVHHRSDPIILGTPPGVPPHDYSYMRSVMKSSMVLDALVKSGVPNVREVWAHEAGGGRILLAVSLDQKYAGHARQVGILTSQLPAAAYMNRYVVVVDSDVDVRSLDHVIWAVCTRSDPGVDIEILHRTWGSDADPLMLPGATPHINRAVIDACVPFERLASFPKTANADPERMRLASEKWRSVLGA